MKPIEKQLRDLRLNGWKSSRPMHPGPNFFDWFKNQVIIVNTSSYTT